MDQIIRLAANALPGEKTYILFAGAGVSKDAGIHTAWDLMLETAKFFYFTEHPDVDEKNVEIKEIEDWFTKSKYAEMEYAEIIGSIYENPAEQQKFLEGFLDNQEPGEAHRAIAEMARRGILRAIVTTNFDHCLEKSLIEKGLDVQVIANESVLEHSEPLIHCKKVRVYKPHGTLGEGKLRNTPKDLESLPAIWEDELTHIFSQHGIIIIGYSGEDKGILNVLSERKNTHYPVFWVNPSKPFSELANNLFETDRATYVHCDGAGKFLNDLLTLQDRIRALVPSGSSGGPSIKELKSALSGKEPAAPLYLDFLKNIYNDIEQIKPDFSKFDNYDDAIYTQIEIGEDISYRFIESSLLAARFNNFEVIKTIYNFFGEFLKLYWIPKGFLGTSRTTDFDGNKYLVYEMFLGFITSLIHYDRWESFVELLPHELFTEDYRGQKYEKFTKICSYLESLNKTRNSRLQLDRISLSTDLLKIRFTDGKLSELLNFKEIYDSDYFLFQYAAYNYTEPDGRYRSMWFPKSIIYYSYGTPSYLIKAESRAFSPRLAKALGVTDAQLKDGISTCRQLLNNWDSFPFENPLYDYDASRMGSKL